MKTALMRILTMATLATSISAFAADQPKQQAAMNSAPAQQQEGCAANTHEAKKQKKARPQPDQNDKDYDRALLGIYG
jgi:hypothetical protein